MDKRAIIALLAAAVIISAAGGSAQAVSLWDDRSSLFKDSKASSIGDIVLVDINESFDDSDEGKVTNTKTSDNNIGNGFGILDFIRSFGLSTTNNMTGNTKVERTKDLTGTVSCIVTDVLPNGNLVIEGDRYLVAGAEKMNVRFSGVVRQMDISHNNRVPSDRVANAEIYVSGKGIVSRSMRPSLINQILQAIF